MDRVRKFWEELGRTERGVRKPSAGPPRKSARNFRKKLTRDRTARDKVSVPADSKI